MKIRIQLISNSELKVDDDTVVNLFINGRIVPAIYTFARSEDMGKTKIVTIELANPYFKLEMKK
jgi:hypothetical protein